MMNDENNTICSDNQLCKADKPNLVMHESARIYIKYSPSNTIINLTDTQGNCILCVTAGSLGFSGAKKASLFAAKATAEVVAKKAIEIGCKQLFCFIKGEREESQEVLKVFQQFGLCLAKSDDIKKK
jgi:small subunit ribosomal protein S11